MGLEVATKITELVIANPQSTDSVTQGDEHIRMIKKVLQDTFPDMDETGILKRDFIEPSGVIKMWAGADDQIPDGYILCDKNRTINNESGWYDIDTDLKSANPTTTRGSIIIPDLADRFILGAGDTQGNKPTENSTEQIEISISSGDGESEHWRKESDFPVASHSHGSEFVGVPLETDNYSQNSVDNASGGYLRNNNGSVEISAGTPDGEVIIYDRENLDKENPTLVPSMDIKPRYYALAYIIKD